MDLGGVVFFGFLGAIIIVPQILRYQERGRLHETLRMAFERGQPVPPELIAALQWRRRRYNGDYDPLVADVMAGWRPQSASPPASEEPAAFSPGPAPSAAPTDGLRPVFAVHTHRDLRRGLVWLAIGLGLVASGGAFYAGLYDVGGASETFASFAALGTIPGFIGLTYLGLWWFGQRKTRA